MYHFPIWAGKKWYELMDLYTIAINRYHSQTVLAQSIMGTPKDKDTGEDITAKDIVY